MGAQQVLRIVLGVALVVASAATARAQSAEPVVVIDLRPGSPDSRRAARETFTAEIGDVNGVQLMTDPSLARALAAEPPPPIDAGERKRASELMSSLLSMRSAGDCAGRKTVVPKVIPILAGLEAAGRAVQAELKLAYAYALGCAHAVNDVTGATVAAARLRALGQTTAPDGVAAEVWAAYPAPAQPPATVEVTIEGTPAGAALWVDHATIGPGPARVQLAPGAHVLGAASEGGVGGQLFEVSPSDRTVTYQVSAQRNPWAEVRSQVSGWRAGQASANALEIAKLLKVVGVRFAILLAHDGRAELWTAAADASAARRLRKGTMKAALPLANAILEEVRRLSGKPAEGDVQILREPGKKEESRKPLKWWVYASIVGAVAVGAGLVIANDLADDTQRFELSWP